MVVEPPRGGSPSEVLWAFIEFINLGTVKTCPGDVGHSWDAWDVSLRSPSALLSKGSRLPLPQLLLTPAHCLFVSFLSLSLCLCLSLSLFLSLSLPLFLSLSFKD